MLIYQEDDLLQLSKICGITGSFSRSLTKPLNQALKATNCSNILFGISNMEVFPLWEYLLSYRKKHPITRLICIYNPCETVLQTPSCQSKLDNLLDQVDIVYVDVPIAETVNVREEPDRNSRVLFTLPRGAQVTTWGTFKSTDGRNEQYHGITDSKGRDGCINASFLSSTYVDPGQPWLVRYGYTVWQRTLHENSSNSLVATLQRDLRAVGYTSITNS